MRFFFRDLRELSTALAVLTGCLLAAHASPPEASVATAHRLAQARTDAQPALKDDLAGQKRTNGGESAGNLPAVPDGSIDLGKVLADHIAANQPIPRIGTIYGASWCTYCEVMNREFGAVKPADLRFRYTYDPVPESIKSRLPAEYRESLPITVLEDAQGADGGLVWAVGQMSVASVRAWAARNPAKKPAVIPQAVSIGKLQMGQTVAAILDRVSTDRGASVISLGSASVYLPAAMPVTVQLSPQAATLTFSGAKPRARYSLLGADINAITISRDRCTVSLAGMPDLTMEVVP